MRVPALAVLLALIAMTMTNSPASAARVNETRALDAAMAALRRAVDVGSDDVIPKDRLRDARIDEVLAVYHPETLEPAYVIAPVRSASGAAVGVIGLSAEADRPLWYRFESRDGGFIRVSRRQARDRASRRAEELGCDRELGEPLLVEGCDRHLYWRLESRSGDVWLVDVEQPERAVLATATGTADEALVPDREALLRRQMPPRPDGGRPDCALKSGQRPASYVIPGMPYHYQITSWYCGPASLQMIFDYYGEEIGQHNIADVADDIVDEGCFCDNMARSAHFSGMSVAIQDSSLHGYAERQLGYGCVEYWWGSDPDRYDEVKDVLCAHYPIMACTWYSGTHSAGHFRVLRGYDDSLDVFVIHDPWYYGSISGPNLLVDQTFFMDDLWRDWTWCWGISPAPWLVEPALPLSVSQGDTFAVDLKVVYRSPMPTQYMYARNCTATMTMSSGLALAGGTSTMALPDLADGDSATVTWDVVATGVPGVEGLGFQAQGTIDYTTYSYGAYSDTIGGRACETVEIAGVMLAGWDPEERLTNDDAAQVTCFPGARAMALDGYGNAHLVWQDTRGSGSSIYCSERVGGVWQREEKITGDSIYCYSPCIDAGPDGSLHVAYAGTMGDQANHEIYYKYWTPGGGWSSEERVTDYGETDLNPSIAAVDSLVHIAWESRQGGLFRAHAVFSSVRSDTGWSDPVDVDASPAKDSFRPSLAAGPDGVLHIVYERHTGSDPNEREKVVHKSWDGSSWSGRTGLSTNMSYSRTPVIAAGGDSTLHVVWQDGENGSADIFYAIYEGAAWQPVEQIVTGGTEASTPSVAVDGAGHVHLAWVDSRHAETEIYYMTNDGNGWSAEQRLTGAPGPRMLPAVCAGLTDEVLVVWTDLRHGDPELYFLGTETGSGIDPYLPSGGEELALHMEPPHPMPFTSETAVSFRLTRPAEVSLGVFDVRGRLVRSLAAGHRDAGTHRVIWDGRNASGRRVEPGVYYVRCTSHAGQASRGMVLVR